MVVMVMSSFFFFKQKTAYEVRISDWSSDVCSSDLRIAEEDLRLRGSGELLGTRQSGEAAFRLASVEMLGAFLPIATDDARLLIDRDGGLAGERGQAARVALYLFERDAGVGLLRSEEHTSELQSLMRT